MRRKNKRRILNCIHSRNTDTDWGIESAMNSGVLKAARALPRSKDLRANWWKVGDQGETGSCVGWATADGVLRWHFVMAGKVRKDKPLSPRYIWMKESYGTRYKINPS